MLFKEQTIDMLFAKVKFLDDWILRVFLGIAFLLHGYQQLPIPLQNMMDWFGFAPWLAKTVPLAELLGGSLTIISGFLKGYWGSLLTMLTALIIFVYMVFAIATAHQAWFITARLFISEQIFLWVLGLCFLLKGKPQKD